MTETDSSRTAELLKILSDAEGEEVTFRFGEPISVPVEKYDGSSYRHDTLPKQTMNATVQYVDVEHIEGVLVCNAAVDLEELDRLGIDPDVVYTEPVREDPEYCVVEVRASRQWEQNEDVTIEEAQKAVEEGQQEEVLRPWDGLPEVAVTVERTSECHRRSYESGGHLQFDPPTHEIGELIDIRVKDPSN